MYIVRCAQLRPALATPSKRGVKNRKALFVTRVLAAALDRHLKVPTNWITQILKWEKLLGPYPRSTYYAAPPSLPYF
ncbi:MAG: hypothetical protein AAB308_02060 [Nitrospirota bacterium]